MNNKFDDEYLNAECVKDEYYDNWSEFVTDDADYEKYALEKVFVDEENKQDDKATAKSNKVSVHEDRGKRRAVDEKKDVRLKRIINSEIGWYNPYPGYMASRNVNGRWVDMDYVRYPKDSKRKVYLKKVANRKLRSKKIDFDEPLVYKGKKYKRAYDLKWELD